MRRPFLTLLFTLLLLAGCAGAQVAEPATVQELIDKGALVVDVRSEAEYKQGHLENALNIPHTEVKEHLDRFPEDKSEPVVVYCRSGRRSGIAKDVLQEHGYTNVVNGGGYADLRTGG